MKAITTSVGVILSDMRQENHRQREVLAKRTQSKKI